jgi:hypothetical protein
MTTTKGFKVFNPDWTCRGFQYEVGKTFEENVVPSVCDRGFHFCKEAKDCFNYYNFDPNNKVAEVVALGEVVEDGDKCATNKIQIVREIPWAELLEMVNIGKGNAGLCNSGNRNSGDCNSGNRNSGDCNSGNRNSGNRNSGDWNSGNCNSGNRNSGNRNSGNRNSGDCNSGNRNSGDWNSGNRNSGDCNSGDWNSGDWNKSSFNAGCFNTEQHKLKFFDKETDMTFEEWRNSDACYLLSQIDFRPTEWVYGEDMTDEEKEAHPEWETTGGYLKVRDNTKACVEWWEGLSETRRNIIRSIPNFDAGKFFEITGIRA